MTRTGLSEEGRFKKILMIACTEEAWHLAEKTRDLYRAAHPETDIGTAVKCRALPDISIKESLAEYVGERFHETDAVLFFAAAGIAVRTIAPYVTDKYKDPAVLVTDESGRFCISLLSGHVGGANELCLEIAGMVGAEPVITTATDREGRFSVDNFAVKRGLWISSRAAAKDISAKVVAGETVSVFDGFGLFAPLANDRDHEPAERHSREKADRGTGMSGNESFAGALVTKDRSGADVIIDVRREAEDRADALYLVPKAVAVGIGCRRGKEEEAIERAVSDALRRYQIFPQSVFSFASIDIKADEPGLLAFAEKKSLPLRTFSAEELNGAEGTFTASEFVRSVTGVDCVSERAAVIASGQGRLIVPKQKYEGVTVAAAVRYCLPDLNTEWR